MEGSTAVEVFDADAASVSTVDAADTSVAAAVASAASGDAGAPGAREDDSSDELGAMVRDSQSDAEAATTPVEVIGDDDAKQHTDDDDDDDDDDGGEGNHGAEEAKLDMTPDGEEADVPSMVYTSSNPLKAAALSSSATEVAVPIVPVCGLGDTPRRAAYLLAGVAAAALWAAYESLPSRTPLLVAASAHANILLPILFIVLATGLATVLLRWRQRPPATAQCSCGKFLKRHSAAFMFAGLLLCYGVGGIVDVRPEAVTVFVEEPVLGGNCSMIQLHEVSPHCPDVSYIGQVHPEAGLLLDEMTEYLREVNAMLLLLPQVAGTDVSEQEIAECTDHIFDVVCQQVIPRCDATCNGYLPPCDAACTSLYDNCEFLTHIFQMVTMVHTDAAPAALESSIRTIFPAPLDFSIHSFGELVTCASVPVVEDRFAVGAPPTCSGSGFDETATDPELPCHNAGHLQRIQEYEAALASGPDTSAQDAWLVRRYIYRTVFVLLVWLVPIVAMRLSRRKDARARLTRAVSKVILMQRAMSQTPVTPSPVAESSFGVSNGDVEIQAASELRTPHGSGRWLGMRPESPSNIDDARLAPEQVKFLHVFGVRGLFVVVLMILNIGVVVQAAYLAETAGDTVLAWAATVVALGIALVSLSLVSGWMSVYRDAVSSWQYGVRSYHFVRPVDEATPLSRLLTLLKRLKHAYGVRFSMSGKYFGVRLFVSESVEVGTQVSGLLQGLANTSNEEVLLKMTVLVVNVFGAWALTLLPRDAAVRAHATFDLMIDLLWVILNVLTLDATTSTFFQAAAIFVPVVYSSITLRALLFHHLYASARSDLRRLRVSRGFSTRKIYKLRIKGFGAVLEKEDAAVMLHRVQSKSAIKRVSKSKAIPALFAVVTCAATAALLGTTLDRITTTDADCSELAGTVWPAVPSSEKKFFQGGIFEPASCAFAGVRELDFSGSDITAIPDEVALFSGAELLDARDCPNLRQISTEVAWMPNLQAMQLDGSPVARSLDWSGGGFTELPQILLGQVALEELSLERNALPSLDGITALARLHTLNVAHNLINYDGAVPLAELPDLREVNISHNVIEGGGGGVLETSIVGWDRLDISFNRLSTVSKEFLSPQKEVLILTGNPIVAIDVPEARIGPQFPPALLDVAGLERINMRVNSVDTLPPEMTAVLGQSLLDIDLFQNVLTVDSFPDNFAEMEVLSQLKVASNPIVDSNGRLPDHFWDLPSLELVAADCTGLAELPADMWTRSPVQVLSVPRNKRLTSVPAFNRADGEPLLVDIDLRATGLSAVPEWVFDEVHSTNLRGFALSGASYSTESANADATRLSDHLDHEGVQCGTADDGEGRTAVICRDSALPPLVPIDSWVCLADDLD